MTNIRKVYLDKVPAVFRKQLEGYDILTDRETGDKYVEMSDREYSAAVRRHREFRLKRLDTYTDNSKTPKAVVAMAESSVQYVCNYKTIDVSISTTACLP